MNYKIYVLKDPRTDIVRYVGQTGKELVLRLKWHIGARKRKTKKNNWIKNLLSDGVYPVIELIEDGFTKEQAIIKEAEYIKLFKSVGANLVNGTNGGEGTSNMTEETRQRMKDAWILRKEKYPNGPMKGKKQSEESKRKMSLSKKGKKRTYIKGPVSEETRQKQREAKLGKKLSEEHKLKLSEARRGEKNHFYGKKHDEQALEKMRTQIPWNKGTKGLVKPTNGMKGKKHNDKTKALLSLKKKGRPRDMTYEQFLERQGKSSAA